MCRQHRDADGWVVAARWRWPGVAVGLVLAMAVVLVSRRLRRASQAMALLVMATGSAVFVADQRRWAGARTMICYPGTDGCAYPAWTTHDLLLGALVGLASGVLVLALEGATRQGPDPSPRAARVPR